eukprot:gene7434-biopygen16549
MKPEDCGEPLARKSVGPPPSLPISERLHRTITILWARGPILGGISGEFFIRSTESRESPVRPPRTLPPRLPSPPTRPSVRLPHDALAAGCLHKRLDKSTAQEKLTGHVGRTQQGQNKMTRDEGNGQGLDKSSALGRLSANSTTPGTSEPGQGN